MAGCVASCSVITIFSRNVRRMICEVLARLGEKVSGLLLEEIGRPDEARKHYAEAEEFRP